LSRTIEEVIAIFAEMGFQVAEGPDIESDYYNFTALNIPPEHPARQEHDTFYLPGRCQWQTQGASHAYLAGADSDNGGQ
jgi:phenylalanyl-tRNA synthetase alpha chain